MDIVIKNRANNLLFVLFINILVVSMQVRAFNEQDVIARVLSNHRNFVSSEIDMLIQQKRLQNKYKDYYGWHLDLTAKYGTKETSTDKNTKNTYSRNRGQVIKNVGLKLSTAFQSGISLYVKLDRGLPVDEQEKYKKGIYDKDVYLAEKNIVLTRAINIPLFQNSDGGENKKLYDVSIIDEQIERLNLLEDKEDEVADALDSFVELVINVQKVETYQQQLDKLIQLQKIVFDKNVIVQAEFEIIKKKLSKNKKDNLIIQVKIKTIKKKLSKNKKDNSIIQAKIEKIKRDIFKNKAILGSDILTLKSFINFDKNDLSSIEFNNKVNFVLLKDIKSYLHQNNRDLKIDRFDIAKKQRYIERYQNKKLMDLDFNMNYVNSQNYGNYSSYSQNNLNAYEVSLNLTYPLGGSASNDQSLLTAILEKDKKMMDYKDNLKKKILAIKVLNNELLSGKKFFKNLSITKTREKQSRNEAIFIRFRQYSLCH